MELDDIVQTCNLKTVKFNGLRGKIIQDVNENGRYGVRLLLETGETKEILVIPQNLVKQPDEDHYGFWGCSDCGGSCDCESVNSKPRSCEWGFHHSQECSHYMNTLRRKGPMCNGSGHCCWIGCCTCVCIDGPCKALDRSVRSIPRYKYPEREWVTSPDGSKTLREKAWPYF